MRRASPGYLLTFALAATGVFFLTIGVDGAWRSRHGLDPSDALNHSGVVALVAAFALAFLFRLIFWERVTGKMQDAVRGFLTLVIGGLVVATVAGAIYVYRAPAGSLAQVFTAFAILSQIASVVWLLKYRRE